MEIKNQNQVNDSQERLDEMKATKAANQKILDDINTATEKLRQDRDRFKTEQEAAHQELDNKRALLSREGTKSFLGEVQAERAANDKILASIQQEKAANEELLAQIKAAQEESAPKA